MKPGEEPDVMVAVRVVCNRDAPGEFGVRVPFFDYEEWGFRSSEAAGFRGRRVAERLARQSRDLLLESRKRPAARLWEKLRAVLAGAMLGAAVDGVIHLRPSVIIVCGLVWLLWPGPGVLVAARGLGHRLKGGRRS